MSDIPETLKKHLVFWTFHSLMLSKRGFAHFDKQPFPAGDSGTKSVQSAA